ncbi:MAG TPA: cyanophycinase, partial [Saprospiraceae bacterium]|nr:cyanophycinase [Saprospiraceae bacterium]
MEYKGILIPVGGNEDKGVGLKESYCVDFIRQGILSSIVRESGGSDSRIAVITTASSIPEEVGQNYLQAFQSLGCSRVDWLDLRKRSEVQAKRVQSILEQADCIMFSGGDQSKIINAFADTSTHRLICKKIEETRVVIAGTSAGAMSMSLQMIAGGSIVEGMQKGNVRMARGMGFLEHTIIDTHFIQRGRFGRLAEAVARFPNLLGIGLAEDTGLIIRKGNDCEVIGSGMAVLFDPRNLSHNRYIDLEPGTPMSLSNLTTHILACGDRFK